MTNQPEKSVEEIVEEFWDKFSMYDLGYKNEGDLVENWLTQTLQAERQRCEDDIDMIIERLMREEENLWSEQKRGEHEYAPGISKAIQIIKDLTHLNNK